MVKNLVPGTRSSGGPVQAQSAVVEHNQAEAPESVDVRQLSATSIMRLQRSVGNQAVQGIMQRKRSTQAPVQRAGPPTPPSLQQVAPLTPEQQRRAELEADRTITAESIATQALGETRKQVETQVESFLNTDSKTAGIRKSMVDKSIADVTSGIDADATATKEQKDDAKKFAAQKAEGSGAVKTALKGYAREISAEQVPEGKKTVLEDKAKEGYNVVTPKVSTALDKQTKQAALEANKKVNTHVKALVKELTGTSKTVITEKVKTGTGFLDSKVNVGTAGTDEISKRKSLDAGLVDDTDIKNVYESDLVAPLKKAVVLKFGVGRRAFRRSKELNAFRQKLKDEARAKARDDIDSQVNTDALTRQEGEATRKYYAMVAKTKAHDMAKVSVDSVMEDEAVKIVDQVVPDVDTKKDLANAGKSKAYDVARSTPTENAKIKTAGVAGAKERAAKLIKDKEPTALNEVRKITKGDVDETTNQRNAPDAAKNDQIKTDVKTKVGTQEIAKKSIKQAVEAGNINSGFTKIGKLIDLSTPNAGDATSLDIELKIPIGQSGGYFLFGFGGEAEREEDELEVSTNLTFGAGFQTFGLDANFRLGLALEATGTDSANAMNLMSYGLYREMRDKVPSAADYFWGQGGKSGDSALVEAEKWAMMIEERHMSSDKSSVGVGMLTKLAMDANVGVAEFSGELAYKRLSQYNKAIIEEKGKDITGTKLPPDRRAAAIGKGEMRNVYEVGTEVEVKFGSDTVAFGLEGSLTRIGGKTRELELELSGSIPSQFGEESGELTRIAAKIVSAAVGTGKNAIALLRKLVSPEEDKGKRAVGTVVDIGTDALFLHDDFESVGASLAEQIQGDSTVNDTMRSWLPGQEMSSSAIETENKIGLSNSLKLALKFSKKWKDNGDPEEWEVGLEASQVKELEVDAEIVKVAVEKSKRIGKLGYKKGEGFNGGLAGLEKG
jgi:hypothetical protein